MQKQAFFPAYLLGFEKYRQEYIWMANQPLIGLNSPDFFNCQPAVMIG
jgi:hypothetical protein